MAQQNIRGIRLRPIENPRRKNRFWIMQMLTAMLACTVIVLTGAKLTGLVGTNLLPVMAAVGIFLCSLYGLLLYKKHQDWFFLGLQIIMFLLVLVLRSRVLEGFRLFWRYLGDARLEGTGWMTPQWELTLPPEQENICLILFGVLLSSGIAMVSCFLSNRVPALLAALVSAAALAGMLILGNTLSFSWMMGVFSVSMLILMYSGWGSENAMASVVRSWAVAGIVAIIMIAAVSVPKVQSWTNQIGQNTQRTIHNYRYETEHTTLPEGDFTEYENSRKAAEAALIITMEQPQLLYLRGFTGSVFEENKWKPLEKELLVKNQDLLYWLNCHAFNPHAQFQAAARTMPLAQSKVTVQNLGACSRYCYVPFSLCDDTALQPENLNTDGVLSDGTRVYTYSVLNTGAEGVAQAIQTLQETEDTSVLQYRKAESAYRQFVKNFYLQVPESVKNMLSAPWNSVALDYGVVSDLTTQQAQDCALRFLGKCFPETGTPEDLTLPLACAEGSSYQYATVAALTFRYYGIPARYAEGYVITEKMAASVRPGDTLAVDGSCARAWVEIYQDGIGWIPMEFLPGLGELIQEDPNDDSEDGDGETENEDLDPEEAEEDQPQEEDTEVADPDGGSVVQVTMMVLTALLKGILLLLALLLILFCRRRYVNQKREKKFCDEDIREATAWIFSDTANILKQLGFDSGNGSMRKLCVPVQKVFGEEYAVHLEQMIFLNDRALFCSRTMDEECRENMLLFRLATIERINTHMKWYRRLWLKWVRCLY